MIDFLRKLDWVPRSVRRRAELLEETTKDITKKTGEKPTETQLAKAMGMNVVRLSNYRRHSQINKVVSLDAPVNDEESNNLHDILPSEAMGIMDALQLKEAKQVLRTEIQKLSERERRTIEMYYFQRQNLKQIGKVLGVTESRACQLRSAAIGALRVRMRRALTK